MPPPVARQPTGLYPNWHTLVLVSAATCALTVAGFFLVLDRRSFRLHGRFGRYHSRKRLSDSRQRCGTFDVAMPKDGAKPIGTTQMQQANTFESTQKKLIPLCIGTYYFESCLNNVFVCVLALLWFLWFWCQVLYLNNAHACLDYVVGAGDTDESSDAKSAVKQICLDW